MVPRFPVPRFQSPRPCVVFLACVHLALFLALSLSPGNSLVSSWCDHSMLASLQQLVIVIANWLFCAADNARRGFHYRHSPNVEKYHHSGRLFRPVIPLFDMRFVIIFMSADHTVYCMVQHLWFWLLKLFCRAGE